MAANPVGFVQATDGGVPRSITATAGVALSGGMFVYSSGAADNASSGLSTFLPASDMVFQVASGLQFNGIISQDVSSGATATAVTKGQVIVRAYGTVTAGFPVDTEGTHAVANIALAEGGARIGRALTSASSGLYCVVDLGGS